MADNVNITPLLSMILSDQLKLNTLWDEPYERRVIHHLNNNNYNIHKKPVIWKINNMLKLPIIKKILKNKFQDKNAANTASKTISQFVGGLYSPRAALYWNDFDETTQNSFEQLALSIKPRLEKSCGEKLNLGKSDFKAVLLRYEGKHSTFPWHYDTEPFNCYRTIILIKSEGEVPPFIYKNDHNKDTKINLELGDGIFFKGTQTYHSVQASNDENMVRWVLGFQYCAGEYDSSNLSLCSELRGASPYDYITLFAPRTISLTTIVHIIDKLFPQITIDRKLYISSCVLMIIISEKAPHYLQEHIGTGSIHTIESIMKNFTFLYGTYFHFDTAVGMLAYLLIRDAFETTDSVNPQFLISDK